MPVIRRPFTRRASFAPTAATLALAAAAFLAGAPARAADDASTASSENSAAQEMRKLPWQEGPADGAVGSRAHLSVPKGHSLLPEANGAKFLELTGNLPEEGNTVLVGDHWWATLEFSDSGYVKDDEKLDPDALLKSMQENEGSANQQRRDHHLAELHTDGWIVPPHYDTATKQLEWGVKLHTSESPRPVVNYTMRLLGRHGYETVILVTEPDTLDRDVASLREVLKGFDFNAGEKYAEFRPGDHVAEYGLGALVLGGATAAAIKGGWFKGILAALAAGWKLVAAAVVAGFAALKSFFGRLFGKR
jgi:uncharacterized membrane-anchored protein